MFSGKFEAARKSFTDALQENPKNLTVHDNLCACLLADKRFTEVVNYVEKLPNELLDRPNLTYNYSLALYELREYSKAERNLGKFLACYPARIDAKHLLAKIQMAKRNFAASTNLLFEIWKEKPGLEIANDLGVVLNKSGDHERAMSFFNIAIKQDPFFAPAHLNLAASQLKVSQYQNVKLTERIIQKFPAHFRARGLFFLSQKNAGLKRFNAAQNYSKKALAIAPTEDKHFIAIRLIQFQRQSGMFDHTADQINQTIEQALSSSSELKVSPFVALNLVDDPKTQLRLARKYCDLSSERKKHRSQRRVNSRIKIGYVTGDFYDHATLYLMQGLFRHHDKSRFEVYLYDFNNRYSRSSSKQQALEYVDRYADITRMSDQEVADMLQQHEIDIIIDLKGYTEGHRFNIFSLVPSALTISFLGYPGTSGSEIVNYLVADQTVIPKKYRKYYSERIIFLPDTYQPTDDLRTICTKKSTRQDHGLPEKPHVVLACFNNILKISKAELEIWGEILIENSNTVLWLLDQEAKTKSNIHKTFSLMKIQRQRIIFAPFLPQPAHLERLSHADVVLDTWAYNAHTTASDALWAGVPLVTLEGKQFAARVASSILKAAELQELIALSPKQYKKIIHELINHKDQRDRITQQLETQKRQTALFDSATYTKNFERGLTTALDDYLNGKSKDIYVTERAFD